VAKRRFESRPLGVERHRVLVRLDRYRWTSTVLRPPARPEGRHMKMPTPLSLDELRRQPTPALSVIGLPLVASPAINT
jgi:hypothetical protein